MVDNPVKFNSVSSNGLLAYLQNNWVICYNYSASHSLVHYYYAILVFFVYRRKQSAGVKFVI